MKKVAGMAPKNMYGQETLNTAILFCLNVQFIHCSDINCNELWFQLSETNLDAVKLTVPEIVAIVAHEIGHWDMNHGLLSFLFVQVCPSTAIPLGTKYMNHGLLSFLSVQVCPSAAIPLGKIFTAYYLVYSDGT